MSEHKGNGKRGGSDPAQQERSRKMQEAVRDLPDPERRKLNGDDVATLRKANLGELAKIAERYVER